MTPQFLGVPLITCQLAKTCGYRVSRCHTHMSCVSRLIPAYLIHKYTKYMIDYVINSPFIILLYKKVYMFWFCSNIIQHKRKQNKAASDSHPACGLVCGSAAYTGPVPEIYSHDGVSNTSRENLLQGLLPT